MVPGASFNEIILGMNVTIVIMILGYEWLKKSWRNPFFKICHDFDIETAVTVAIVGYEDELKT